MSVSLCVLYRDITNKFKISKDLNPHTETKELRSISSSNLKTQAQFETPLSSHRIACE